MALAIIKDWDAKLFEMNGIKYVRNFQAVKSGNTVRVTNAYDSRFSLASAHFSQYVVNGAVFLSSDSLVSALSPILFVKDVIDGDTGEASNHIGNALFSNINGAWINSAANPITAIINLDTTGAVKGGSCAVYFKGTALTFTGGTIVIKQGNIIANELCLVWIVYDKADNGFHVNIQTGFVELPANDNPEKMTINAVSLAQPEKMTITDIT